MSNHKKRSIVWSASETLFREEVKTSLSIEEVGRRLDPTSKKKTQPHYAIKQRIEILGLNTDHFLGCRVAGLKIKLPSEDVFIQNSPYKASTAKRHYIGLKHVPYECKICGHPPFWLNRPLALTFDHINGNNRDHRLENLRWLCPMCNSQTDTFAGRNKNNPNKSGKRS